MTIFVANTPQSVVRFFTNISEHKLYLIFIAPIISLFMTHETAIYTLLMFISIDLVTGIQKDLHIRKIPLSLLDKNTWVNWKAITSQGYRKTWIKIKEYGLGVMVIFFLETNVIGQTMVELNERAVTLTLVFIMLLAATEVWSIFENREAISERNMLKKLLGFLPEKIKLLFSNNDTKN